MSAARACERILPLLKPDHSAKFAFLPDGQDPDSLVNAQGKKALENIIQSAIPLVDFIWMYNTTGQTFDTPEARAGLSKTLENEALRITDREIQHYYRQAFREKVNKAFGQNYQKNQRGGQSGAKFTPYKKRIEQPVAQMKRPSFSKQRLIAQILIASVLNHPSLFDRVEEDLGRLDVQEPRLNALRQAALGHLCDTPEISRNDLVRQLMNDGFESEMRGILCEAVYTHAGFVRQSSEIEDVHQGWQQALEVFHQA